jgi:hypothetical protein
MNVDVGSTDSRSKIWSLFFVLLLVACFGAEDARAQAVCTSQPYLGTNGPELCVSVYDEGTGDTWYEGRPVQGQGTIRINRTIGNYRVDLEIIFVVGPLGMEVRIEGPVRRTSPGSGWITVRADGGTNVALPTASGSLLLDGTATAASGTHLGGGAGFRTPGGDVEFRTFSATVERTTYGAGAFFGELNEIPVAAGAIAVTAIVGFHVNNVGDSITIPAGVVIGNPPMSALPSRRWSDVLLDAGLLPVENRVSPLTAGSNPELVVANISYDEIANYLNAYRVSPPYGPTDVTDDGIVDSGFIYGIHKICVPRAGRALVPYIKGEGTSTNVWVAQYDNSGWTKSPVAATVADDYHSVTCFETVHGSFLKTLNFSRNRVEIFKRTPVGDYDLWMTMTASDLEGTPQSPALGAAIGKAGHFATYGEGGINEAVFTVGLDNGTVVAGQFRTDVPELTGIWNAGPANGETSIDISYDEVKACHKASMNWMAQSQFNYASWCLSNGPETAQTLRVGTTEPGTLIPEFQGVSGAGKRNGTYYALADKCYMIDASNNVTELWSYPPRAQGGPIDLVLVDDPVIEGFAAAPGSQMLGILSPPPAVSDLAVPAVARVRGAGAFFTSIMHLFDKSGSDLELEMTFTPRAGSGGEVTTVNHTVPAGVMQTIEDPLEALFGFGGSAGRVGSLSIDVTEGSPADLMVQTVVFAQLNSGEEYGQFFPAMRASDAITAGQTAYLNTTEDPAHNRVNIGLMALVDGTQFRVTPVDPLSNGLAAPMTYNLDTGGNTQINNLHSSFGLGTRADVVVEVEVVTGSGLAYASVLDGSGSYSGTSDPTTILPSLGGSAMVTLLEIGSIQGLNEFSGSASITNYSERTATVRADFYQRGVSGVSVTENLTIAAGDTLGFTDLGADLFGVSGDVGTVELTATNGTQIGATGREFAIFRDTGGAVVGTAGQLIAGQTDSDRLDPGMTYHFIGLRQTAGGGAVERSHFAVYNPATTDAEVTVRLYDGATGALEGQRSWTIGSKTLIQVNNVIRVINPGFDSNEKRIEVEVNRRVFMNAFRVNRWGDPVTLSPFPG